MDKSRYPTHWTEISQAVRERAGQKCEQCGVPNGALIVRRRGTPDYLRITDWYETPTGKPYHPYEGDDDYDWEHPVRVILTVHHKGVPKPDGTPGDRHDKMDVRDENLAALCQRCHLLADLDIHIQKAKITRARKREEWLAALGQGRLFE